MSFAWLALTIAYLAALFWVARWGDSDSPKARSLTSHPFVYSLALGIYCTAWTFFGAVGQSSSQQWMYLPILLGPVIVYVVFFRFIYKMTHVSKKQHISTIADFISSRYGKRQVVALLVTVIALLATIPYVALQLKAIGATFQVITNLENTNIIIILATSFIALFAMYFGTRNTDVTEYRRGLILAISLESCIKLIALVLVAFIAYGYWSQANTESILFEYSTTEALQSFVSFDFWMQTLMAGAAVICLPRQFHVAVIDNLKIDHLKTARWFFPSYLILIALTIPIIAAAGKVIFAQQSMDADNYVMGIALFSDLILLQIVVFIGGLSAATAMIIVATLTLSTMITNDLVLPKLMDSETYAGINRVKRIKHIRRFIIFGILLLAFLYQLQMTNQVSLSSIGLLAFSLVIQLLPSIVGGLYWQKGHAHGVYAGLLAGFLVWLLFLFIPSTSPVEGAINAGNQTHLFSLGALYSLLANVTFYVIFSLLTKPTFVDRIQAKMFVEPTSLGEQFSENKTVSVSVNDLKTLISKFTGQKRCDQLFEVYENKSLGNVKNNEVVDQNMLAFCERALGGVVGSSSARALIESLIRGKSLDITDVVNFFDGTAQAMQFNMSALLTSLENIDQGISVIDKELKLIAWNKRYTSLFNYPEDLVFVGAPIEPLVIHNVIQDEIESKDVDSKVEERMTLLRNGTPHKFRRNRADGHVIEMVGNPLPEGGFVISYHDITGYVIAQEELKESNINLAARVEKRTEEVHSINAELRLEIGRRTELEKSLIRAKKEAENANDSKTRFLALASHDVIQPLNAAKLYLSALQETKFDEDTNNILTKLSDSVVSSESLISTILDISRLDGGEMKPFIETVNVIETIQPIVNEMSMKAKAKGLSLRFRGVECWVSTDKTYLYRIILNLVSNAVKYTKKGKVLLTVRKRADKILIQVRDTGIGILKLQQAAIFSDFYRVENTGEQGIGLGLGVVKRLSQQLPCTIKVESEEGKGSCFDIEFTSVPAPEIPKVIKSPVNSIFSKLKILCIDDQQENLDAMQILLVKWGIEVGLARSYKEACSVAKELQPHILLVDYQLGKGPDGLEIIDLLRRQLDTILPACLVTAKRDDDLLKMCSDQGVNYLSKPLKPGKLRALIQSMTKYIRNVDVASK
ncbi:PAS domain-containing hybrid sensor histidine kinase/response regulator [Glaciecola petra]|uniref:histidine kinase n=1 Tax=Glaciecola petra TaxID=3075602 RepID=A0ABU2ZU97_9ALTE|nr:PAS-domain containing protein [Aestuariibacter sp. P117]MDT0596207.1 PAS-domain containing protein [Aestuariibacter sp. P117]